VWIRQTTTTVKVPTITYGKIPARTTAPAVDEPQEIPELIAPTDNPFTSVDTLIHRDFHNRKNVKKPDEKIY
jgi:hypothetical protein